MFGCADLFPIARDADASGFLSLAQHYLVMYLGADLVNCALIRCVRSRYWQCWFWWLPRGYSIGRELRVFNCWLGFTLQLAIHN